MGVSETANLRAVGAQLAQHVLKHDSCVTRAALKALTADLIADFPRLGPPLGHMVDQPQFRQLLPFAAQGGGAIQKYSLIDSLKALYLPEVVEDLGVILDAFLECSDQSMLASSDAVSFCRRGYIRQGEGDILAAIEDYNHAIFASPKLGLAYFRRGNALAELARHEDAIADYNIAVALDEQDSDAYYNRGLSHFELCKYEEAVRDFDAALSVGDKGGDVYYSRGLALDNLGLTHEAIRDYTMALDIDPDSADAYLQRAWCKYGLGDLHGALSDCSQSLLLNPDDHLVHSTRGCIQYVIGNK